MTCSGCESRAHALIQLSLESYKYKTQLQASETQVLLLRTALADLVEHTDEYDTNQQQHEALEWARELLEDTK